MTVLLFFDISGGELLIILLAAFLLFGPSKMPDIARKIGKSMSKMKNAADDLKDEIRNKENDLEKELDLDLEDENKEDSELKG